MNIHELIQILFHPCEFRDEYWFEAYIVYLKEFSRNFIKFEIYKIKGGHEGHLVLKL